MQYVRMPIEVESPEERGYETIAYNLSESSVADLSLQEIGGIDTTVKLAYTDHKGKPALRKLIADQYSNISEDDVLLSCGAAAALFMINTCLLNAVSHLVVVRPNYATNIAVPVAAGCAISYIDLTIENQWRLDIAALEAAVTSNTKLISITSPHNPTGMMLAEEELKKIIAVAEANNIYLLVDETYRDICFDAPYPLAASMSEKVISISSVSKAYGLPGLRIGWAITKDKWLFEKLLAAKEMIHITNSVLDEELCFSFLQKRAYWKQKINKSAVENLAVLKEWLQKENRLEYVLPQAGVVCFPAIKKELDIDYPVFYEKLLSKYGTMVGPGHWFDMSQRFMRIGFAWTDKDILAKGLENISRCLNDFTG
ncbi:MAG: aminotransferase class I/II-fold pyridoxal phosphate-dependent enzyme [Ferruginibacter sp.]